MDGRRTPNRESSSLFSDGRCWPLGLGLLIWS
jgi:hypothetical protein